MKTTSIMSLIDKLNPKLVVLLCHHNADPDAVFAAFTLSQLLKRFRPQLSIDIAAAQGPSKLSKHLLNTLQINMLTLQPRIDEADLIVLLDTNTIQQLDKWAESVKASCSPIIAIDHHAAHPETQHLATLYIIDEEASSTCEIIYQFFKEMKVELTETEAKALFLGIAFDTRHFILANSVTFNIIVELIEVGVDAKEALSLLSLPMDFSERVARLKACQNMMLKRVNNWLMVSSQVSAFQSSAARALLRLGAHVAVVAGQRERMLQISLRSCQDFYEKTGIHLGRDIANPLGEKIHGMGGGHSTAAGVNGIGDVEATLKRCMNLLMEKLN